MTQSGQEPNQHLLIKLLVDAIHSNGASFRVPICVKVLYFRLRKDWGAVMKNYGALKTIAFVMKLIGWLTIAFAVVGFVIGLMHNPYNYSGAGVVTGLVGFYSLAAVISGIVSLASGEPPIFGYLALRPNNFRT
jgi:hypothetical protein